MSKPAWSNTLRCLATPAFFSLTVAQDGRRGRRRNPNGQVQIKHGQQIAQAAIAFEQRRTGNHAPKSVTVVLSEGTVVITLHEALSPAERVLAQSPAGPLRCRNSTDSGLPTPPIRCGRKSKESLGWKCAKRLRKSSQPAVPSCRRSQLAPWCKSSCSPAALLQNVDRKCPRQLVRETQLPVCESSRGLIRARGREQWTDQDSVWPVTSARAKGCKWLWLPTNG